MDAWISIGVSVVILVVVLAIFVRISMKVRRGGSGTTTVTAGALHDLHSREKRRAIETILEINAGKELEDQKSSDSVE